MTDVVLINPPVSFERESRTRDRSDPLLFDQPPISYPPLGLAYMGAVLERDGLSVRILNAALPDMGRERVLAELRKEQPKIIGISLLVFTLRSAYALLEDLRALALDAEVVVGGIHVADDPQVVAKLGLRHGFVGEADFSFARFCVEKISGNGRVDDIDGLVTNEDGRIRMNRPRVIRDLETIPLPAMHLLFPSDYYFTPADPRPMTVMITSRGCPFQCTYCHFYSSEIREAFPYRRRDPAEVIREMKWMTGTYGVEYIEFVDGTFTVDRRYTETLMDAILEEGIRVSWGCETRANLVDEALLRKMKDAGCKKVAFGVETGLDRTRYLVNKKISNRSIESAFRACHALGIETKANLLLGVPTETEADLRETIRFARKLNPTYAEFHVSLITPNIQFHEIALREGTIPEDVFDRFMEGTLPFPRFTPRGLTPELLDKIDIQAHRRFYLRPGYILRRLRGIRSLRDLRNNLRVFFWLSRNFFLPNG